MTYEALYSPRTTTLTLRANPSPNTQPPSNSTQSRSSQPNSAYFRPSYSSTIPTRSVCCELYSIYKCRSLRYSMFLLGMNEACRQKSRDRRQEQNRAANSEIVRNVFNDKTVRGRHQDTQPN